MRKAYCDMCGAELHADPPGGWSTVTVGQRWGNREKSLDFCASCHDKFWSLLNHLSAEVESEWTEGNNCSRCGEAACAGYDEKPWRTRYCPHCGVKMKNPEVYE